MARPLVKVLLIAVTVATVMWCAWARQQNAGWLSLIMMWVFPVLFIAHVVGAGRLLLQRHRVTTVSLLAVLIANLILISATLLQFDVGDDYGWFAIQKLIDRDARAPLVPGYPALDAIAGIVGFLLLGTSLVSSFMLFALGRRYSRQGGLLNCTQCGYLLRDLTRCPECGHARTPQASQTHATGERSPEI